MIIKKAIMSIRKYGLKEAPYTFSRFLKGPGLISRKDTVRAYWHEMSGVKNFGDMITPYLIKKISNKNVCFANEYCLKEYFIVAGSVLEKSSKNAIIWGAGIMDSEVEIKKPKKTLVVRGPLTRKRIIDLGYDCPKKYGDPGLILPLFYNPKIKKNIP